MKWTREKIEKLLCSNPKAVERAMVFLYEHQTLDEQQTDDSHHNNNKGFAKPYAPKGSYYARWVLSGRNLTGWHFGNALKITKKHSRQLVKRANENEKHKQIKLNLT